MIHPLENEGVLTVVLERFQKFHLPRIMDIKDSVDNGGKLNQSEIMFLSEVFKDTQEYSHFVSHHSEFHSLFSHITSLYDDITTKALNNEGNITKISTSNQ